MDYVDSELANVLKAGIQLGEAKKSPIDDGKPYVVVPDGCMIEYLDETLMNPPRCKGTAKLRDAPSFIYYFNRFSRGQSQIYATLEPAKFIAVLDENEPAFVDGSPFYREYRAEFQVPSSEEWKRWNALNRKAMGQLAFAELVEDNLPDIVEPSGNDLLQMSLNFEVSKSGSFKSVQRLQSGNVNLAWVDETKQAGDSGTMTVPESFKLNIPVFENGLLYPIDARLKYRVKDGTLSIWYELVRPHKVLDAAFREIWTKIASETERTIMLGLPE
jgi:uncharacterized protein YfdQ (DUF2303 family)